MRSLSPGPVEFGWLPVYLCITCVASGCGDDSSAAGTPWLLEESARASHDSGMRRFLMEWDDGEQGLIDTDLVIDVIDQHGIAHFQGVRDGGPGIGPHGFSVSLTGELDPTGSVELQGHRRGDGLRLTGQVGETSVSGEIRGSVAKDGLAVEFDARLVTLDSGGQYPCRGYRCADHCAQTSECAPGYTCESHPSDALPRGCVPDDERHEERLFVVLFVSTPGECESEMVAGAPAPGADLLGVTLKNRADEAVGAARPVSAQVGVEANGYVAPAFFDGDSIVDATCPRPAPDLRSMYSLGCGGSYIAVVFNDDSGIPVPLSGDLLVDVRGRSTECADGSTDSYEAWLCTDTAGVYSHDLGSCNIPLGVGLSGSTRLALPGR